MRAVDLDVAVRGGFALDAAVKRSLHAQPRFSLVILTILAAIGLALVGVGVYGVMAYAVSRRAQEFAIRMALGATGEDVMRTVVRAGLVLLGVGVVMGLAVSQMTNRLVVSYVVMDSPGSDARWSVLAVTVVAVPPPSTRPPSVALSALPAGVNRAPSRLPVLPRCHLIPPAAP